MWNKCLSYCECGSSFNLKEFDTFKCFKISTMIYNPVEDDIVIGHIELCVTILGHRCLWS